MYYVLESSVELVIIIDLSAVSLLVVAELVFCCAIIFVINFGFQIKLFKIMVDSVYPSFLLLKNVVDVVM